MTAVNPTRLWTCTSKRLTRKEIEAFAQQMESISTVTIPGGQYLALAQLRLKIEARQEEHIHALNKIRAFSKKRIFDKPGASASKAFCLAYDDAHANKERMARLYFRIQRQMSLLASRITPKAMETSKDARILRMVNPAVNGWHPKVVTCERAA
mgnify:CR=1 FL=1